jgi:tetratricopeptide (TPR) repeat protein
MGKKKKKPVAQEMSLPAPKGQSKLFYSGIFLLFFVIAILIYGNSLKSPFIWDDPYLITDNHYIKSFNYIPKIFKHHLYYSTAGTSNFYRPLQTLFLMADYALWGKNPLGYHFTSLICHIICAFLSFLITELLFKKRIMALIAGLLFLIHPINSTVVDYISSRADSQATLFILLSFWLFFRTRMSVRQKDGPQKRDLAQRADKTSPFCFQQNGGQMITDKKITQDNNSNDFRRPRSFDLRSKTAGIKTLLYIGSLLSFICALLSKELGIILPFLILVSVSIIMPKKRVYIKTIPFFIILGIYGFLRLTVLNFASSGSKNLPSLYIRLLTTSRAFVKLIGSIFWPTEIHIEKSIPYAKSLFEPKIFISVVILIGIGIFLLKIRRHSKICFFGFAWFFVSLLPMANIVPINATITDHWLYLPCIGFFIAIVGGIYDLIERFNSKFSAFGEISPENKTGGQITTKSKIKNLTLGLYILYGLIVIILSIMTIRQNFIWREPLKFYQKALLYSPKSFRAYNEMGVIYLNNKEYDKAISTFQKAIQNNPRFDQAYDNLGVAYDMKGDFKNAIWQHKKALEINPNNAKTYNNLGNAYNKSNQFEEAIEAYNNALKLNPSYKAVYNNLGVIYYKKGMYVEAIKQWKKVLKIDPYFKMARDNIRIVREEMGKKNEKLNTKY